MRGRKARSKRLCNKTEAKRAGFLSGWSRCNGDRDGRFFFFKYSASMLSREFPSLVIRYLSTFWKTGDAQWIAILASGNNAKVLFYC